MPLNPTPFNSLTATNGQNLRNPQLASSNEFPPEGGQNRPRPLPPEVREDMQELMSNLQEIIDNPPSQESLDQLHNTIETAREDGAIAPEENEAITQATLNVFESMGLTSEEIDTLRTELQTIAENAPFPGEPPEDGDDFLLGNLASNLRDCPPMNGPAEEDALINGGALGPNSLGDPGLRFSGSVDDFGAMSNPNFTDDTIPFQGNEGDYGSGNLPHHPPMPGMGLAPLTQGQFPGLMGILAGIEMTDFSQGLTE